MKALSDLSSYTTEKELKDATGVDKSDLAAKKHFIVLKTEVYMLDLKNLSNVTSGLNNLKNKGDDSNVDELQILSKDLKKLRVVVSKNVNKKKI